MSEGWSHDPNADEVEAKSLAEAVWDYIHNELAPAPADRVRELVLMGKVRFYRFSKARIPQHSIDRVAKLSLDCALRALAEEYGPSQDGNPAMAEAARRNASCTFAWDFARCYDIGRVQHDGHTANIDLLMWARENEPGWLEGEGEYLREMRKQ